MSSDKGACSGEEPFFQGKFDLLGLLRDVERQVGPRFAWIAEDRTRWSPAKRMYEWKKDVGKLLPHVSKEVGRRHATTPGVRVVQDGSLLISSRKVLVWPRGGAGQHHPH